MSIPSDEKMHLNRAGMEFQPKENPEINQDCISDNEAEKLLLAVEDEEKDKKNSNILVWGAVGGCIIVVYLVGKLIISTENK